MSCAPGQPCEEGLKRRRAMAMLGVMALIFAALSVVSFIDSRNQVVPTDVEYAGFDPVQGKRVFQAFNCMGCHTIVGNGAYFAPDLTKLYNKVGPAWLEAFLPSAASWPKSAAVRAQLQNPEIAAESGVTDIDAYLEKYPAAAERIERRSNHASTMPNLPLSRDDIGSLIAFLKYTSLMNNEGWPPVPKVNGLNFPEAMAMPESTIAESATADGTGSAVSARMDPVAHGEALAADNGCMACHSSGDNRLIGPGWGGLYGSEHVFDGNETLAVDDAYLTESILSPNTRIPAGYSAGIMPAYAGILKPDEVDALVAYIRSLQENK